MVYIRTPEEIQKIRVASQIVADTLIKLMAQIAPGMTTNDLDRIAEQVIIDRGVKSAFKGYHGYPKVLCASVNEEVVHGIPDDRIMKDGDIVGVDFGVSADGWFGDSAVTIPIGKITNEAKRLMKVTQECLEIGISMARPGVKVGDLGAAIQEHAEKNGYGIVREFVGHGVGRALHEEPQIPNYGRKGTGIRFEPGMVIAIEPMVTAGSYKVKVLKNQWTAVTVDGSLAAHFEHTVAITDQGPVILSERSI